MNYRTKLYLIKKLKMMVTYQFCDNKLGDQLPLISIVSIIASILKDVKKKYVSVFQKTILNLYSSVKPRYSQRKQPTSRDAATCSSCSALLTDLYDVEKKPSKMVVISNIAATTAKKKVSKRSIYAAVIQLDNRLHPIIEREPVV